MWVLARDTSGWRTESLRAAGASRIYRRADPAARICEDVGNKARWSCGGRGGHFPISPLYRDPILGKAADAPIYKWGGTATKWRFRAALQAFSAARLCFVHETDRTALWQNAVSIWLYRVGSATLPKDLESERKNELLEDLGKDLRKT
jgi:hypothetical protein